MNHIEQVKAGYKLYFHEEHEKMFSCGGRFEILGNNTDHNHGLCLASACNLEIIAATKVCSGNIIRLKSEGFDLDEVDLTDLSPKESEYATGKGLIRGVASYLKEHGYKIGAFNAYTVSTIFKGAGVSSSAAFELLIGHIFNDLFNDSKISKLELCKAGKYAENVYFGKKSGLLDQIGVGYGGLVEIDFFDIDNPVVNQVQFPFSDLHFVIVNTGGDHSSLSDLYSAIPLDMYNAAKKCGHEFLSECSLKEIEEHKSELSDIEYTRALHFFGENERVRKAFKAINDKDKETFLRMINESRKSSTQLLKNMMVGNNYAGSPLEACDLLLKASEGQGVVKINGGGFAGSIISVIPTNYLDKVLTVMKKRYGDNNVKEIFVRNTGPVTL